MFFAKKQLWVAFLNIKTASKVGGHMPGGARVRPPFVEMSCALFRGPRFISLRPGMRRSAADGAKAAGCTIQFRDIEPRLTETPFLPSARGE